MIDPPARDLDPYRLVGLSDSEAIRLCEKAGRRLRVIRRDGRGEPIRGWGYDPGRINVEVETGRITKVSGCY